MSFAMSLVDAFHKNTCFHLILQIDSLSLAMSFAMSFRPIGDRAEVSGECPEPVDGEMLV